MSGIYAAPGGPFNALLEGADAGLVGTLGFTVITDSGQTVQERTTAGITSIVGDLYKAEGVAPEQIGDYIIRWDTGGEDPEFASEFLYVRVGGGVQADPDDITPTLEDVGSILRARTRSDETGSESGTFSESTRPTSDEVLELMEQARSEVVVRCPADLTALSDRLKNFARRMVALRTAMLIELSLYPDQSVESDSIYDKLREDYESLTKTFLAALADGDGANVGGTVMRSATMASPFFEPETEDYL